MEPTTTTTTREISAAPAGDGDAEMIIIQDNRQSSLDAGRRGDADGNEPKSLIMELYPWMQQFKKMCRTSLFQPSMTSLKHLMMYYTRNVRPGVNECYTKPLRAEKLKDSISESLLFFLYYWREIAEDHDRASYMDLMTDLLAMYIDMELKASKRGREHSGKIAARLSSCLQVYLEHSAEHLLDTLLKVHFMTHNYHEILDPVITKIFKGIQEQPSSSVMYVRYFLAYRLWKKLNKNVAVRNQINVSAVARLGAAPSDFPPLIVESVLPKVPNSQRHSTKSLLLHNFDVDKGCEEFVKFCKRERELSAAALGEQRTSAAPTSVPEDSDARVSNVHSNVVNVSNEAQVKTSLSSSLIPEAETNGKAVALTKPTAAATAAASPLVKSSLRKSKKSNDIVFIDLTSDNVTEKVIRQKRTRRKLQWLEEAKKRVAAKPPAPRRLDSPIEAEAPTIQQLEDTVSLDSLRIGSPRCLENMEVTSETSAEERTTPEDCAKIIDEGATIEQTETEIPMTSDLESTEDQHRRIDSDQPSVPENPKNAADERITEDPQTEMREVESTISNSPAIEAETTTSATVNSSQPDELFAANTRTTNDARESPSRSPSQNAFAARITDSSRPPEKLETNKSPETRAVPPSIGLAIKAERVTDEAYEIINEDARVAVPPTLNSAAASRVPLEIRCGSETPQQTPPVCPSKIRETEFQDNIDGLALLASVSQRVSHLTTTTTTINATNPQQQPRGHSTSGGGELIKVKNYASLANSSALDEPVTSSDAQPPIFCPPSGPAESAPVVNRVVGIFPEDAMDKVAYQVEVTSSGDVDPYENGCVDEAVNGVVAFPTSLDDPCRNVQPQIPSVVTAESTTQAEKDDANVILNGETVVLFQKSPNSNLYIINKAVENRDHGNDEIPAGIREIGSESSAFGYEFPYDGVYRNQSSLPYDLTYNREASGQESRRCKKSIPVGGGSAGDSTIDSGKTSEAMELTKLTKPAKPLDAIGKTASGKRAEKSRRRRIKQEFNGVGADLTSRIAPGYGIQDRAQDSGIQAARSSIHIPATHSSPLSSIYTTYTGGAELYLPCQKSCSSMTCGLPQVNSKGSAGGKNNHCNCLNCTYGIVAHCGECILQPGGESHATSIEKTPYYLPMHSAVQPSVVQDRGGQESLVKIFDDQLVCKLEMSKTLDVGVKCEPKEIYRAELDNKLPLKKRFKAMMSVSFEEMAIKREKAQSYPGTPMISIAALDSPQDSSRVAGCVEGGTTSGNDSLDLSPQERGEIHGSAAHHASEMIRRDYRKDLMMMMPPSATTATSNGHRGRGGNGERKRKRRTTRSPSPCDADDGDRHEGSCQRAGKTSAKSREIAATNVAKRLAAPGKTQVTRPSEKVKEPLEVAATATPTAAPSAKSSARQTRSSKRNVPKVNYIYTDGDSDWNPSGGGGAKRKRKKTSR